MIEPILFERQRGDYSLSTDRSRLDIPAIHTYLSQEAYWSKGIPLEIVRRAIQNSLCFGIYQGEAQVGFARVISDYTTFAYLCDVFILEPYRGQGLGKWLVACVLEHPNLQGLRQFLLFTFDAHGLYARYGFAPLARPERVMSISKPDIYRSSNGT
jgi:GNAT superfamily N-acetyltransferase